MFDQSNYELLDFGDGRRLERLGQLVLDRPCPAAEAFSIAHADAWAAADARFEGRDQQRGQWTYHRELPDRWTIAHGPMQFELKRTEFGHLGVFPEQAENWDWIGEQVRKSASQDANNGKKLKILNLFAYTGGSTLAAAAAGAEVVHLDAAKNIVAWARRNAAISGLTDAPIHWIAEDALKFCKRELRRGNRYDAVILDPPSYGHGTHGEVWRLSKHLPQLLSLCGELTEGRPRFMLLTCHTPGFGSAELRAMVAEAFGDAAAITTGTLKLRTADGRELPSGNKLQIEN